jgi:predicted regulator of Ras-like GTPase activity (Roadblock/LC7/MglB family)
VRLDEEVRSLVDRCPGARGAAIVGPDGIPVVVVPDEAALEALGAEFASVMGRVEAAGREFHHGGLQQLSVYTENAALVLTPLASGYFLVLVLSRDALAGQGRFLSRLTGERVYSEFV